ncbi:MAG: DUF167 domain-containing protein [Neorhizobium sp.]|nr:DUF167 domain-containing protein [Neorhizobium sp.]
MSALSRHTDHVRLSLRLTPSAGRDAIDGFETAADGESFLRARVTSVPENGKANRALIQLLAKTIRIPKSAISLVSGETARKKILRINGDPEDLEKRLSAFETP